MPASAAATGPTGFFLHQNGTGVYRCGTVGLDAMTDRTGPALLVAALAVMVVAAVDGLVPAGAEVTDRAAGPQGAIPEPGPYRAYVEYEAPGDRDTRAAKLEALDRRYKRLIEQLEPAGVAELWGG